MFNWIKNLISSSGSKINDLELNKINNISLEVLNSEIEEKYLAKIAIHSDNENIANEAAKKIQTQTFIEKIVSHAKFHSTKKIAIKKIDINNQNFYEKIATTESDWIIRIIAVRKLKNQNLLISIAESDKNEKVRVAAIKNIEDNKTCIRIVESFSDQNSLSQIALSHSKWVCRKKATKKVNNAEVLKKIANKDEHYRVRLEALRKIKDQKTLIKIAFDDNKKSVRESAVKKISDIPALKHIADREKEESIRYIAISKLVDKGVFDKSELKKEDESEYSLPVRQDIKDAASLFIRNWERATNVLVQISLIPDFYDYCIQELKTNPEFTNEDPFDYINKYIMGKCPNCSASISGEMLGFLNMYAKTNTNFIRMSANSKRMLEGRCFNCNEDHYNLRYK